MVMQCPFTQMARNRMFNELSNSSEGQGENVLRAGNDILLTLLGKEMPGFPLEVMVEFWLASAKHIADMYRYRMKMGIG